MGWTAGVQFMAKVGISPLPTSRTTLGPTQPPSEGVNWSELEADHPPPFNTKVKNVCVSIFTFPYSFMAQYLSRGAT